ncbi:DUF3429 domain-containing protein [Falsiroseomonas selenitidurans]|nr:DUF3429 domain-containing protein [Falsiroseomonas selenitidurans]
MRAMTQTLHPLARPLGAAGLLPFLLLALALAAGFPQAGPALAAYGATILAFLGAVHWGLALAAPGPADPARLVLGVVPALLAWLALLLPLQPGLALLAAGILATAAVEQRGMRAGLLPQPYMRLRWWLSGGAGFCLLAGALLAG